MIETKTEPGRGLEKTTWIKLLEAAEKAPWMWMIVGLACGMVIAGIGCGIVNKGRKKRRHAGTIIALNISSDVGGRIVEIMRTHVPIGDLHMEANTAPVGLRITGYLKPKLQFCWEAEIAIKSLRLTKTVPTTIRLTPSAARQARKNHREGVRNNHDLHRGGRG